MPILNRERVRQGKLVRKEAWRIYKAEKAAGRFVYDPFNIGRINRATKNLEEFNLL